MASETITENIFRDFYGATTFIEKSAIPKTYGFVSKKDTGYNGYPDFFLDNQNSEYVIIVEAKAEKHSLAKEEVLWYMHNNNITKDIIGIAFTGQNNDDMQINYFTLIQGKEKELALKNVLISLENIDKIFKKEKYGDYLSDESLQTFLSKLNEVFHKKMKIPDVDRSLFFSGIMIALCDTNFRNTYRMCTKPKEGTECLNLNRSILQAISMQLKTKINSLSKEINWIGRFSFIEEVVYPLNDYKRLLNDIETKIFIPFQSDEKQDILGKAYKTFLSRAGKVDNKNIILTPDHIKRLMVKLADLNVDDVVLDTCTGTGGFLMEAMEVLFKLALEDEAKIRNIKENQLIGFETNPILFSLACSNMFLHGDGRTNLLYRSSLLSDDENIVNSDGHDILKYVKSLKPTKCIINPPYENNGGFLFTEQAIDYLEPNGILVIIMPSNILEKNVSPNGSVPHSTDALLEKATLNFVIKMPENLFQEQNRTIQTSIFGFTKKPHNKNKEVMFYNLDDDGFVSVQHKGRLDIKDLWKQKENDILDTILNYKIQDGISYRQKIYDDNNNFTLKDNKKTTCNLVKIKDLFNVEKDPLKLQSTKNIDGEYYFITGSAEWKTHICYSYNCEALIFVAGAEGSLGRCHYVNDKFVASDLCFILTPKNQEEYPINLNYYQILFNSIKENLVADLKRGSSKKAIGINLFKEYGIPYVAKDIQDNTLNQLKQKNEEIVKLKQKTQELQNEFDNITKSSYL